MAAFSNLSVSLVDLLDIWLGAPPGDVFAVLLAGNDILIGRAGLDTIFGGAGNDIIEPGSGADIIDGGTDFDQLRYDTEFLAGGTKGITVSGSGSVNDSFGTLDSVQGVESIIATAQGIIQNDDTSLRVVAGGAMTQTEGNTGLRAYNFTVQRQGITTGTSKADYAVTAAPATASDFDGAVLPAGSLTFLPGQTSQIVTVNVAGDTTFEADEAFRFTLSNPTGAAISTAILNAVIQSDDSLLSIAATSANKPEGTAATPGGTTAFTFTVTRTGALGVAQGVSFTTAGAVGGGTAPATAPDFATGVFPAGSFNFAPGQTTRVITINTGADQTAELNDRFAVTLASPTGGAQLGTAVANGIILNDDFVSTPANQALTGTANPDFFLLGGGLDTVAGLAGLDRFIFRPQALGPAASNATTLTDFSRAAGEQLDLSLIDAIAGGITNDAFSFLPVAGAPFTNVAGQLRWEDLGAQRLIQGDVNGDSVADLTIRLAAAGPVDATWFVL